MKVSKKKSNRGSRGNWQRFKGIVLERKVKNLLISEGYLAIRSPRSLGLFDVWGVNKDGIRLIQIKYNQIPKEELARIRAFDNIPKNATKEVWIYRKGEFEKMIIATSAFGELIDLFFEYCSKDNADSTVKGYRKTLADYQEFLDRSGIDPLKIKPDEVRKYLSELYERELTPQTRSIIVSTLRKFYTFLFKYEIIKENVFDRISNPKVVKHLPEIITEQDMIKFLDSIKDPLNSAICETLYATGLKTGELLRLHCEDIDFTKGAIKAINIRGQERILPITGKALRQIKRYREYIDIEKAFKGPLFLNSEGKRLTEYDLDNTMKNCSENSGLGKNITPSLIRSSMAAHLINRGMDLIAVGKLMGHETIEATLPYAQLSIANKKAVIDNFLPRNGETNTEIKSPLSHLDGYIDDAMPKKCQVKYRFEK